MIMLITMSRTYSLLHPRHGGIDGGSGLRDYHPSIVPDDLLDPKGEEGLKGVVVPAAQDLDGEGDLGPPPLPRREYTDGVAGEHLPYPGVDRP
jgi:hypothetical protein